MLGDQSEQLFSSLLPKVESVEWLIPELWEEQNHTSINVRDSVLYKSDYFPMGSSKIAQVL